jgi:hypothetical protein
LRRGDITKPACVNSGDGPRHTLSMISCDGRLSPAVLCNSAESAYTPLRLTLTLTNFSGVYADSALLTLRGISTNLEQSADRHDKQHGAAEARRARNPEVPGSKLGAANFFFLGCLDLEHNISLGHAADAFGFNLFRFHPRRR